MQVHEREKNALLNIKNHKPDIDKTYLYAKNSYTVKYQLIINKRESKDIHYLNESKAFTEYSNDIDGIYKNIEEYNPINKLKILIISENIIADILSNRKI